MPEDEDPEEWNWEALAKLLNTRWKLNLRDRELKKIERGEIAEMVIEKAREAIEATDFSEGAPYLAEDYGVRTACAWVQPRSSACESRCQSAWAAFSFTTSTGAKPSS